jgi:hypothetical protein
MKACPFCGEQARRGSDEFPKHINAFWCENCLCEFVIRHHAREDSYLKWWNERKLTSAALKWIEEAESEISVNKEIIAEVNQVSSCDRDYWNRVNRAADRAKKENQFLLQGIKILKGETNEKDI